MEIAKKTCSICLFGMRPKRRRRARVPRGGRAGRNGRSRRGVVFVTLRFDRKNVKNIGKSGKVVLRLLTFRETRVILLKETAITRVATPGGPATGPAPEPVTHLFMEVSS